MPRVINTNRVTIKFAKGEKMLADEYMANFGKLQSSRAGSIEAGFTRKLKQGFLDPTFSKAPVDTGRSYNSSNAKFAKTISGFNVLAKVNTKYASFFVRGVGTSRRYGRRDVFSLIKKEASKIAVQALGIKTTSTSSFTKTNLE